MVGTKQKKGSRTWVKGNRRSGNKKREEITKVAPEVYEGRTSDSTHRDDEEKGNTNEEE